MIKADVDGRKERVTVNNTLHVPHLRMKLLSMGKIRDRGLEVAFDRNCAKVLGKENTAALRADRLGHLYFVKESKTRNEV